MKKSLVLAGCFLLYSVGAIGQELVNATFVGSFSKSELTAQYGSFVEYGVEMYRVLYTTPDIYGVQDTASGLLVVPDDRGFAYPLVCYQHGTVNSRQDVPSNLAGGYEIAVIFGALGYVTSAADFLGLGTSRGIHPYVHADSEASAAVDMLYAARSFLDQESIAFLNHLFITGYSQGGHAAMAAHRLVEAEYMDEFELKAAAPMSGPYDISGAMSEFTLGDQPYFFPAYLGWVALSYQAVYGIYEEIDQFFKQPYATEVQKFAEEVIDLNTLNTFMIDQLTTDYGAPIPKFMLQDSIQDALLNNPMHPINQALAANDVYDWSPQVPTRLVYCTADDQVYFRNSIIADSVMTENNAFNVDAQDVDPTANHGGCVEPALNYVFVFFGLLQTIEPVSATLSQNPDWTLTLHPNPTQNELHLGLSQLPSEPVSYQILDLNGKVVRSGVLAPARELTWKVENLPTGLYLLELNWDGQTKNIPWMKQ